MQTYCIETALPPLTALVVGKTTGLPGNGFVGWDVDDLDDGLEAVFRYPWSSLTNPFEGFTDGHTEADFATTLIGDPDNSAEVYSRIRNRGVAQRIFRRALLESYGYSCCMCGNTFESGLEAAHIIPWRNSSVEERLDVRNGLLLCCNHHKMFDAAEIIVSTNYQIEYYDPQGLHGPYAAIDRSLSIDLHDQAISLPENNALSPSKEAIASRRKMDGWSL